MTDPERAAHAGALAKLQLYAAERVCDEYFSESKDIVVQLAVAQLIATNMAAAALREDEAMDGPMPFSIG